MRNFGTFALLFGAVFIATTPAAHAQKARVPADIQKDYDQFIGKFRGALKANDGAAVTEMTKFPFYWDQMRDADYFRKNIYGKIFTTKVRNCIARGKGVYDRAPDGSVNFTHFCGEETYLFTKTPDGFRFAETGVND
jgi:hypothetical protein